MEHFERTLSVAEILEIVSTGSRPICFCEKDGEFIWGFGSSFLLKSNDNVFVITAKHVFENQAAEYHHTRVLMPDTEVALPVTGAFLPSFPNHENSIEVEDFILLEVDTELFCKESGIDLYTWDFDRWSFPASMLEEGAQILIAGFPFTEDRYDWDNKKINELLLISIGYMETSSLGNGIYAFDGDPSEIPFNGLSGAPVFCRRNGYVYFVGLVIRGTEASGKIHFIGSEFVRDALSFIREHKQQYGQ